MAPTPVPADVITVLKAEHKSGNNELRVQAKSSDQPDVTLTVVGFGVMKYKKGKYEYKTKPVEYPGTVTITSSAGGTITVPVVQK